MRFLVGAFIVAASVSVADAGDAITAWPAVAGGRLVVGTHDVRVYCFG